KPNGLSPGGRVRLALVPVAVAVASLSVFAGVASSGGGGVTPPDPPELTDVVFIANCAGVHKAASASKVQLSGRHLANVDRVLFNSSTGPRIGVDPSSVESHNVTATVPDGAATGHPKVEDSFGNASKSPATLT